MNHPVAGAEGGTAPRGRWSTIVAVLIVVLFVAAVTVEIVVGPWLPSDFEDSSVAEDFGLLYAFGVFTFTGALLVAKRPRNPVSWMVAAVGLMPSVFQPLDTYGSWTSASGRGVDLLGTVGFWAGAWYWFLLLSMVMVFLPLYFPNGRLPSPRWRPWAAVPILSTAGLVLAGMLQPTVRSQIFDDVVVDNPIGFAGMPGPEEEFSFLFAGLLFGMALAIAAVAVRFRRSQGMERQQLKVFLFAASMLLLLPLSEGAPPPIGDLVFPFVIGALPIAIGFAVLRHRLYGIDRLISRTLSYALLTALLVGVYALGVLGVGALVPGERSDMLVAASTLAVAAVAQPLHGRTRRLVDRRFNRSRYDAARVIESFGTRLRDEVDLPRLSADLHDVVRESFQPTSSGLWLRTEESS